MWPDKLPHNESCRALQVVIRVRPPLARELQGYRPFENAAIVDPNQRVITLSENLQSLTANGGQSQSPDNGMVCAEAVPAPLNHPDVAVLECPHVIHLHGSSVCVSAVSCCSHSRCRQALATVSAALHLQKPKKKANKTSALSRKQLYTAGLLVTTCA